MAQFETHPERDVGIRGRTEGPVMECMGRAPTYVRHWRSGCNEPETGGTARASAIRRSCGRRVDTARDIVSQESFEKSREAYLEVRIHRGWTDGAVHESVAVVVAELALMWRLGASLACVVLAAVVTQASRQDE